jgi:hypothetical protein
MTRRMESDSSDIPDWWDPEIAAFVRIIRCHDLNERIPSIAKGAFPISNLLSLISCVGDPML